MNNKEYLITLGELDYCQHMLFDTVKSLNQTQPKAMQSPINQLIDNATGFNGIDWKMIALTIYWCEQVIIRKKKLEHLFDTTETLRKGLEDLMKKSGKEDFYDKVKNEIDNELQTIKQ